MHNSDLNPEIFNRIRRFQEENDLNPKEVRILDYGCGSGASVLALRLLGYQAYGVDIDEKSIIEGRSLINASGLCGESVLFVFSENTPIPFPDGMFNFIFSQEVLEHVRDLSVMSREMRRVSAPGSNTFHVFRPQFTFMEQHFHMPFVHWLPKNKIRLLFISLFSFLGMGMRPPEIPNARPADRAKFLYKYSVNQTYYRPYKDIGLAFKINGFSVSFPATDHRKIRKSQIISRLMGVDFIEKTTSWLINTFIHGYILTTTPSNQR